MRFILRHLMALGISVFILQEQIRMCPGMMDLSLSLFYKYWRTTYAADNTRALHG